MASKVTSLQSRRGPRLDWSRINPVLLEGEFAYDTTNDRFKVGGVKNGKLANWKDLEYFAPVSRGYRINDAQTGDLAIDSNDMLSVYNVDHWVTFSKNIDPIFEGDIVLKGSINITEGCFVGDVNPCEDDVYTLGVDDKRWNSINLGTGEISLYDDVSYIGIDENGESGELFKKRHTLMMGITDAPEAVPPVGVDYDPSTATKDLPIFDKPVIRIKYDGDDIALRKDFGDFDTRKIPLWRSTDADGNIEPTPRNYQEWRDHATEFASEYQLPPQGSINTQSDYNEWVYAALRQTDDSVEAINADYMGDPVVVGRNAVNVKVGPVADKVEIGPEPSPLGESGNLQVYVPSKFDEQVTADSFIKEGGVVSQFLRADGQARVEIPLVQSDWRAVPTLS